MLAQKFHSQLQKQHQLSSSDSQQQNLTSLYTQLIPAFYHHRYNLQTILKQLNPKITEQSQILYPINYYNQKINQCKQQNHTPHQNNKSLSKSISRNFITSKIIQNKKKIHQEQILLLHKYQNQSKSSFCAHHDNVMEQLTDNHIKYQLKNNTKYQCQQQQQQQPYEAENQFIKNNSIKKKNSRNSISKIQHPPNPNSTKPDYQQSIGSSRLAQKPKNPIINLIHTDSLSGLYQNQKFLKKSSTQHNTHLYNPPQQIPSTKIKYHNRINAIKSNQNIQNNNNYYQNQQYNQNNQCINTANQLQHYQTYSQQGPKQFQKSTNTKFDTYSQKNKPSSKFISSQMKKLQQQKQQIQLLKNQVVSIFQKPQSSPIQQIHKSNSNDYLFDTFGIYPKSPLKQPQQLSTSSLHYIFHQICQLYSRCQCHKYLLKNKQYQILKLLYHQEIGKGPIFAKQLIKGINTFLKNIEKSKTNIIQHLIFNGQTYITFDQFGSVFSPMINKYQYDILSKDLQKLPSHQTCQTLTKLFSLFLQIYYFQVKLKKIWVDNTTKNLQFIKKIKDHNNLINLQSMYKFIYSSPYVNIFYIRRIKLVNQKYNYILIKNLIIYQFNPYSLGSDNRQQLNENVLQIDSLFLKFPNSITLLILLIQSKIKILDQSYKFLLVNNVNSIYH